MKKRCSKFLVLAGALSIVMLSGCGGAPSITELSESDAIFTVDACQVTGTVDASVLSMEVAYTVTNSGEKSVSELTLLTPHLKEGAMNDLQLLLGEETYELTIAEKDVIALETPLEPGEQADLSISYHIDDLPMPEGAVESWRITIPTLEKSATATGIGEVAVHLKFDQPMTLKSSMPMGLRQQGETEITGSLGNLVNLLVLELQ